VIVSQLRRAGSTTGSAMEILRCLGLVLARATPHFSGAVKPCPESARRIDIARPKAILAGA
jgi:hypothetical protein